MLQFLASSVVSALGVTRHSTFETVVVDVESLAPEMFNTAFMVADGLLMSNHKPCITNTVPVIMRGNSSTIER